MQLLRAFTLATFVWLQVMGMTKAVTASTIDAPSKQDSSPWADSNVVQPTRTVSLINHDNDYMNLQSLLTKNIPGTAEEKNRIIDLMLQLLAEIDLPTLCEVIANDTSRKTKNPSRDVKETVGSEEAILTTLPTSDTRPRNEEKAFAIPYFNILGQSTNNEQEAEVPSYVGKGLSHESITRYHKNMMDRVNKGMNAMREYGNKRRSSYANGLTRNKNIFQNTFNANVGGFPQVDEKEELRNLHSEDSVMGLWSVNSEVNGDTIAQMNSSEANGLSTEIDFFKTTASPGDILGSKSIWIQSMGVERPHSELYSRSLMTRDSLNNGGLIRTKRIDEGANGNNDVSQGKLKDILFENDNLVDQFSTTEEGLYKRQPSRLSNMLFPDASTTAKSSIIVSTSSIYNSNELNGQYQTQVSDKYDLLNSVNDVPSKDVKYAKVEMLSDLNSVHMSKAMSELVSMAALPLDYNNNVFSTQSSTKYRDENIFDFPHNSTFEAVNLSQGPDASIDDFFGASIFGEGFVNSRENDDLLKSPTIGASTSIRAKEDDKVTSTGESYLTNVLSSVSRSNNTTTQVGAADTERNFDDVTAQTLESDFVNSALNSSNNFTTSVSSRLSNDMGGNKLFSTIRTSSVPLTSKHEADSNFTTSQIDNNFVMSASEINRNISATLETYIESADTTTKQLDTQNVEKTAYSLIRATTDNRNYSTNEVAYNSLSKVFRRNDDFVLNLTLNNSNIKQLDRQYNDVNASDALMSTMRSTIEYSNDTETPQSFSALQQNESASPLKSNILVGILKNSAGYNSASPDIQELHISKSTIPFQTEGAEPYVRYEPSGRQAENEPSLHLFGPFGDAENKPQGKHDVVVADVVSAATPEMSLESAKEELEMELKKLYGDVSSTNKDLISVMRGDQRGALRGVSATSYQNFLAQPVMKTLKRIHDEFRRRDKLNKNSTAVLTRQANSVTDMETVSADDTQNTPSSPLYNIADVSFDGLKENVTFFTNDTDNKKSEKSEGRKFDHVLNDSYSNQSNVTNLTPELVNRTTNYIYSQNASNIFISALKGGLENKSTILNDVETEIDTKESTINVSSSNFSQTFAQNTSREFTNVVTSAGLMNLTNHSSSSDMKRERPQIIVDGDKKGKNTSESIGLSLSTNFTNQEKQIINFSKFNNLIVDNSTNRSTLKRDEDIQTNNSYANQSSELFSYKMISQHNTSFGMKENSTNESTGAIADKILMTPNITGEEAFSDVNIIDNNMENNETQVTDSNLTHINMENETQVKDSNFAVINIENSETQVTDSNFTDFNMENSETQVNDSNFTVINMENNEIQVNDSNFINMENNETQVSDSNFTDINMENSENQVNDSNFTDIYMENNQTQVDDVNITGNMENNESQSSDDFFKRFWPSSLSNSKENSNFLPDSEHDNAQNMVDDSDTQKEDQMWKELMSDYLNKKNSYDDIRSLEEYQNELMNYNGRKNYWKPLKQNLLHHPKVKFAVKPEASPFLAEDLHRATSKTNKFRQVAKVNPWKAFNIELGKEKVKLQKEALKNNFRYPSFKIRHHDDLIIPSVKDYLWNARPWPKHEKILTVPSNSDKNSFEFSKVNEILREKQRNRNVLPSLPEHAKLWGNRFSQGYYGRVLDERSQAPSLMSSYMGLPGDATSRNTVQAKARSFLGYKGADQRFLSLPQVHHAARTKDDTGKPESSLVPVVPENLLSPSRVNQFSPSLGDGNVPVESDVSNLSRRVGSEANAVHNSVPGNSMVPPGPTGVPAADDFKCPGLFGYYSDPENCGSFFVCSWGVSYRLQCSDGTLWNSVDAVCDWAANVSCDQRKSS